MSKVVWGEVYSFQPLTKTQWRETEGKVEGYVRFWVQLEGSDLQPHGWLLVRIEATDKPRSLRSLRFLEFDPDFLGPMNRRSVEQAVRSYIEDLFQRVGWEGFQLASRRKGDVALLPPQPFTFEQKQGKWTIAR